MAERRSRADRSAVTSDAGGSATDQASAGAQEDPASAGATSLAVREGEAAWTAAELDEVRAELTSELERITVEVSTLQTSIAEVLRDGGDGAGDDQADTGSKAFEREQELTLLANAKDMLFQTEHALRRLADGSYGDCEVCGNPIGKQRLQAFPRAALCVTCKQRQERR